MWFQDMARSGKFVDHMWFEMAAEVLERDIVLIPLHPQNNGDPRNKWKFEVLTSSMDRDGRNGRTLPSLERSEDHISNDKKFY